MRAAFAREPNPDASARRDRLARLLAMVRERERDFVAAIDRDFGHRSSHETRLAELRVCLRWGLGEGPSAPCPGNDWSGVTVPFGLAVNVPLGRATPARRRVLRVELQGATSVPEGNEPTGVTGALLVGYTAM